MNPAGSPSMNAALHRELWTSWASLLRSYAAAHGLNSRHHAVVEVGPDLITLRVNTRWLRFTPTEFTSDLTSDLGQPEPFALNENGTVTIGRTTDEMDMTAERLTRAIMQTERVGTSI